MRIYNGTYKTAWRIFKQVRSMLAEANTLEGSSVEVDETYVGGKDKTAMPASAVEYVDGARLVRVL